MAYMNTIYKKKNYKIYGYNNQYIIHNTRLLFEDHHTHINNFHTCKFIIDLCIHKTVPKHLSEYLLVSIIRITDDQNYKDIIRGLLDKSNKKKDKEYKSNIPDYITKNSGRKVKCYGKKNRKSK